MTDWFIRSKQHDNGLTAAGQARDAALMGLSRRHSDASAKGGLLIGGMETQCGG